MKIVIKENKRIIKVKNRIIGFVYKNLKNEFWFAFGSPSQSDYISFKTLNFNTGINSIKTYKNL